MKQSYLLARYRKLAAFIALALPALTHLRALAQTCPDNIPHITSPTPNGTSFVTSENLGTLRNDFSTWFGMAITVGPSPITVNSLGRLVAPGNSQVHTLKIVDASTGTDIASASTNVDTTQGTGAGTFAYGNVSPPITLSANGSYYILSQEVAGGDQWYDSNTTVTTTSDAGLTGPVSGTGAPYTVTPSSTNEYVPLDFTYTVTTPTATPTPGSFAAVILATEPANLKGYWKCDETSGTTLADSSGNSENLTITGAINANYWLGETGEQGTCFRADGVAGYASRNDAVIPSLDNTNFTLFALFKGGTDFGVLKALAITNSLTTNDLAFIGQNRPTSQAIAQARGHSTIMGSGIANGTAFDGNWHSITFRRNGTAFELFVDGTRVASTTATLATGSTCNRTSLMHMLTSGTTAYAKGSIQHAAIWNRALSDSEIVAIQTARTINPTPTPTP